MINNLKKNNFFLNLSLVLSLLLVASFNLTNAQNNSLLRAGLRSSVYGFDTFPDSTWWYNATSDMASKFNGTSPSVIWILGYTTDDGCYLNFPNPTPGTTYSKITFGNSDKNEKYLSEFDNNGVKVWLQIEPGFADISTLIELVFNQYSHHSCVIGFGVDVEWYKTSATNDYEGVAVTDEEAESWITKIRSYNENYLLFTKHWLISKMPPTYRDGMVFVDDSQIFSNMNSMINEFEDWGKAFATAKVAFQYGYDSDKVWWNILNDPPKIIGDEILKRCDNVSDLYWVDFTANDIWPKGFVPTSVSDELNKNTPTALTLYPVYPNPFNPSTTINFNLAKPGQVNLEVFNLLGQKVLTIISNENMSQGLHEVKLDMSAHFSGIYFLVLQKHSNIQTSKMVLIK